MADTFSFEDAQKPLPAAAAKPSVPATFSFEEALAPPKPGVLEDVGNAVRSTGEKIGAAWLKAAQSLGETFPGLKDEGLPAAGGVQDTRSLDQLSADLNRDAAKHAPQTIPGQVAGALAYAPFGAAAPLVMGSSEGVARSQALQDQGVDAATANRAGTAEGALQGVIGSLPLGNFVTGAGRSVLAKSVASSVGKAAAAGAGQSVASDAATQAYLEANGYDEQAKNFAPSFDKAAEGALFMGAFHGGMQGAHVVGGKVANAIAGRAAPVDVPVPEAAPGASVADQLRAVRPPEAPIVPGAVPRADLEAAKSASVAQAKAADPVASADAVMAAPTIEEAARAADAIINAPLPGLNEHATGAQDGQIADALHAVDGLGRSDGNAGESAAGTGEPVGTAGLADGAEHDNGRPAAGITSGGVDGVPVADGPADAQPALAEPAPVLSRLDQARQKIARQEEVVQQALDNIAQRNAGGDQRNSIQREAEDPTSWVIRNKATGEVIAETYDKNKVDALNTDKYEAVPAMQHLGELNDPTSLAGRAMRGEPPATPADEAAAPRVGDQLAQPAAADAVPRAAEQPATEPAAATAHDDGADIPRAFWKKTKVPHEVWIADEGVHETVDIPAHKALASVREDIDNLQKLLDCMKG